MRPTPPRLPRASSRELTAINGYPNAMSEWLDLDNLLERDADNPERAFDPDCLFCKITAHEIPAEILATSTNATAIRDINPQAPLHALVIPNDHYDNVAELAAENPEVLAELVALAEGVTDMSGDSDFRLIFNNGPGAGQSVNHVHGHVLAGKQLGWNPA